MGEKKEKEYHSIVPKPKASMGLGCHKNLNKRGASRNTFHDRRQSVAASGMGVGEKLFSTQAHPSLRPPAGTQHKPSQLAGVRGVSSVGIIHREQGSAG